MQSISKLYDIFAEEGYQNEVVCKADGGDEISSPTPIYLQKWDSVRPLFTYMVKGETTPKEELLTLFFDSPVELENPEPPTFKYLFWLERNESNGTFIFKYIECGSVKPLPQMDIAFDDSTKLALQTADSEKLSQRIANDYIFDAGKYKLLFVKAWQNGTRDWQIFGLHSNKDKSTPRLLEVGLGKNKKAEDARLINKERYAKVKFPTHFDEIDVLAYETINIVDIGQAQEAHDSLLARVDSGNAVMALWQEYSKIEFKIAQEESDDLGNLDYECSNRARNGRTTLTMRVSNEQAHKLKELSNMSARLNVVSENEVRPYMVTLLGFNMSSREAVVEDENYKMPDKGRLRLSVLGNEMVKSRRDRALKELFKGRTIVLRNLLFAIENEVDSMFSDNHAHIPALSKKTISFLKERYGIEHLTKNQEEAVEMALNNRNDITVIQGPPGTGKTTVIAAICHRLLELENKKKKERNDKAILASAFQNDTIEHLASKIYTHGLPTVKIGKRKSGLVAEKMFIEEMEKHFVEEIAQLGGEISTKASAKLSKLAMLFEKEKDIDDVLNGIEERLPMDSTACEIDIDQLNEIKRAIRGYNRNMKRDIEAVKALPVSEESYNFEDGSMKISDFLARDFNLQPQDVSFLKDAPDMNPSAEFMEELVTIRTNVLRQLEEQNEVAQNDFYNEILQWLQQAVVLLRQFEEKNYDNEDEFLRSVLSGLKADLHGNTDYIRNTLQHYGETVAATNQLAGSSQMTNFGSMENVVLEEAARSNPLDLLIPMVRANNRIILVGDQFQLPHLLETDIAEESLIGIEDIDEKKEKRRLYEKSLFGIIFDNVRRGNRRRCITLQEQFRMHPTIGNFISDVYYDGQLTAGTSNLADTKRHNLSLPWAKDKTMIFCNISSEKSECAGKSKFRPAEAERIMSLVDELRSDPEFKNLSIGIITFYSRQVTALFEEASKPEHGYAVMTKEGYDIHPDYKTLDDGQEKFRIGSVDSFQGKEFDVVILSTVRSNKEKREEDNEKRVFGFLTLKNRLNVAFSRAKKMLIVAGDETMFEDDYAKRHVPGLYEFNMNASRQEYGNRI